MEIAKAKPASGQHLRQNVKKGASEAPFFVKNKVKQGDRQLAGNPLFVRLYPGLSVAALKAGLDKELALWYELRAINDNGSSRLLLNDALAALVKHFSYSQATTYRLLQVGDGKLWDIKRPPLGTHDALYKRRRKRRLPFWTGYLSEGQANYSTKTPS
ncbi:unnamed protein product, partial [marine sediment metagenome]